MDVKRLNDDISVAGQISATDLEAIAGRGFRSVICNRPDGEAGDQPPFQEIHDSAVEHGLECVYLPVQSGKVTDADARAFADALRELPRPVLAYCRTGTRSVILWSLASAGQRDLDEILATTKAAGYDMSGVAGRIDSGGRPPG